jgi:hypothetical protein
MAAGSERAFVAPLVSSAGGRVIASPFQFWTTGEDNLRVLSVNAAAGVVLTIQGRFIDNAGVIRASKWDHTPLTTRTARTSDYTLGVGAVLNLTVFASSGSPLIGQTYVVVQLVRGTGTAAIVLGTLLAGYVTAKQALAFPGSPIVNSIADGGVFRRITGSTPAAGAEIAEAVPTGARWMLISMVATLVTDATAINRTPNLFFNAGGLDYFGSGQSTPVAGSSSSPFWWSIGMALETKVGLIGSVAGILGENRMLAGFTFLTRTSNIQPGDQWSAPSYLVQEWLEVD